MSIEISCYTTCPPSETEEILARVVARHGDLFDRVMTRPKVRAATPIHAEIASEHGVEALSFFLISLKDKSQASRVPQLADILRGDFNKSADGKSRVLILRDNEKPI